ncbi:MAG: hypothetical protein Q8928_04725 [Bacteroidota bacterium]|nr:hypothetical protein [Bacteroidota bacterium]
MKDRIYLLIFCVSILTSCNIKNGTKEVSVEADLIKENKSEIKKTFNFDYGFNVEVGKEENFKTFKTYSFFELKKSGIAVYTDTSQEYEFSDKLYPIVLQTGQKTFELLFEVNDRPNKNYLKRLFIKDGKVTKTDKLPTFITKAYDLNNDGNEEYAGFWDYSEVWGESESITDYNPILYYRITTTGLQLDSLLTIERNKAIYGQFYGFDFSEKIKMPISISRKFEKEITRITNEQ